jgi:hypothetical protein
MTPRELQRIFQKGECLSIDTMRLYQQGKLSAKSMHEVEKHLLACNLCAGAIDGFTSRRSKDVEKISGRVQRRLAVYMNTPPRISFIQRFGLALTASAVVLVAGSGLLWWWLSTSSPQPPAKPHDTAQNIRQTAPEHQTETIQPSASSISSDQRPELPAAVALEQKASDPQGIIPAPAEKTTAASSPPQTKAPEKVPPAEQETPAQTNIPSAPTTRTAELQPLRIQKVTLYGKTTHTDASSRRATSSGGQLGSSSRKTDGFLLEEMPQFPGGDNALCNYFMRGIRTQNLSREQINRLSTGLSFVVNAKTGEVSDAQLSFSVSPEADAEILRLVKEMPRWIPGSKRGEIDVRLGITFE